MGHASLGAFSDQGLQSQHHCSFVKLAPNAHLHSAVPLSLAMSPVNSFINEASVYSTRAVSQESSGPEGYTEEPCGVRPLLSGGGRPSGGQPVRSFRGRSDMVPNSVRASALWSGAASAHLCGSEASHRVTRMKPRLRHLPALPLGRGTVIPQACCPIGKVSTMRLTSPVGCEVWLAALALGADTSHLLALLHMVG